MESKVNLKSRNKDKVITSKIAVSLTKKMIYFVTNLLSHNQSQSCQMWEYWISQTKYGNRLHELDKSKLCNIFLL